MSETPEGLPKRNFPRKFDPTVDSIFFQRLYSQPARDFDEDVKLSGVESTAEFREKVQVRIERAKERLGRLARISELVKNPAFKELEQDMMEVVFYIDHTQIWEALEAKDEVAVFDLLVLRKGMVKFFESFGSVSNKYAQTQRELDLEIESLEKRFDQAATSQDIHS